MTGRKKQRGSLSSESGPKEDEQGVVRETAGQMITDLSGSDINNAHLFFRDYPLIG
jgi:hypothetical protein